MDYQACQPTPFAVLGIRCDDDSILGVDFLPPGTPLLVPQNALASSACQAIHRYLSEPGCPTDLPLNAMGTPFQQRVWQAMRSVPCGQTVTYAELARQIGSGARAVANACGANPIPLFIPCHRIVAANGLGGFMRGRDSAALAIKHWLLAHERSASTPA